MESDRHDAVVVQAAAKMGARRIVYISVVGADKIPVVSGVDRIMSGSCRRADPRPAFSTRPV